MEADNAGTNTAAFDCCFHPEAIELANKYKQFATLLQQTAMEGVEASYQRQKQQVKLDREAARVVRGIKYIRGQTPSMLIDASESQQSWRKEEKEEKETNNSAPSLPPASSMNEAATALEKKKKNEVDLTAEKAKPAETAVKKGFLLNKKTKPKVPEAPLPSSSLSSSSPLIQEVANQPLAKSEVTETSITASNTAAAPVTPSFTLTERGVLTMGDFEGVQSKLSSATSLRPAELVYRIDLQSLQTSGSKGMKDVTLDVGEKSLSLRYKDKMSLEIALPYEVFDKRGTAKYDSKARVLTVTLPVKPRPSPQLVQEEGQEVVRVKGVATDEVTIADDSASSIKSNEKEEDKEEEGAAVKEIREGKKVGQHDRWVATDPLVSTSSSLSSEEMERGKSALSMEISEGVKKVITSLSSLAPSSSAAGENNSSSASSIDADGGAADLPYEFQVFTL